MNLDRAREFYSAYYEGGLDDGLRQAFQRALSKDSSIADEYSQFVRIMDELKNLDSPIEFPAGLHESIMRRLEIQQQTTSSRSDRFEIFFALRPLAYGTAATIAILATIFSLSTRQSAEISGASFGLVRESQPTIVIKSGKAVLQFSTEANNVVRFSDSSGTQSYGVIEVEGQAVESPIVNTGKESKIVRVSFDRGHETRILSLPGSERNLTREGSGTAVDFVRAVSDYYAVTILLTGNEPSSVGEWKFEGTDLQTSISDELKVFNLSAEVRTDGLVQIVAN